MKKNSQGELERAEFDRVFITQTISSQELIDRMTREAETLLQIFLLFFNFFIFLWNWNSGRPKNGKNEWKLGHYLVTKQTFFHPIQINLVLVVELYTMIGLGEVVGVSRGVEQQVFGPRLKSHWEVDFVLPFKNSWFYRVAKTPENTDCGKKSFCGKSAGGKLAYWKTIGRKEPLGVVNLVLDKDLEWHKG